MDNAHWLGRKSRCIEQRIVVEGELLLQTPAHFGNGDSDMLTDMPLLVDAADGVSPLLTGATLAGALRAYLWSREKGYRQADPKPGTDKDSLTEALFGGFKQHDDGGQSALIVDDACSETFSMQLRDGVRLDPQTRAADDGALFDMQVWSVGTIFPIRLELLLSAPYQADSDKEGYFDRLKKALLIALQGLSDGGITLGGRKNRGYGRITVNKWRVKTYDLLSKTGLMDWLEAGNMPLQTNPIDKLTQAPAFSQFKEEDLTDKREYFRMNATFKLDGSLLIRANGLPGTNSPDMVHLSDHNGKPVLSGTSVTGALRQRARRILHLIDPTPKKWQKPHPTEEGEFIRVDHEWLTSLFGDEEMRGEFHASRLLVEETKIEEPQFDLVQNRVAIDRFTGGALDTALFNEQPVFGRPETHLSVNIMIRQPQKRDIGLMLLLLKDLWTGDLPLGGEVSVGRGRLAGITADLTYKQADKIEEWRLIKGENGQITVETEATTSLQSFVDILHGKEVTHGA